MCRPSQAPAPAPEAAAALIAAPVLKVPPPPNLIQTAPPPKLIPSQLRTLPATYAPVPGLTTYAPIRTIVPMVPASPPPLPVTPFKVRQMIVKGGGKNLD